jgi:hypothetical protein
MIMGNVKKVRIDSMELDEISLVGSGDDPQAKVIISKAAPDKNTSNDGSGGTLSLTTDSEENMGTEISKDDLPPEVIEYIEDIEDALADALGITGAEGDDDDNDAEDRSDELVGAGVEKSAEEILKSNPELAAIVKAAQDEAAEAKAIAKAEQDKRLHGEMISKAAALPEISAPTDELAEILKSLYAEVPEVASKVEQLLKAANTQLQNSALFEEIGKSTRGEGDPVAAAAAEIRKESPQLTPEQAEAEAFRRDPSLYTAELKGA